MEEDFLTIPWDSSDDNIFEESEENEVVDNTTKEEKEKNIENNNTAEENQEETPEGVGSGKGNKEEDSGEEGAGSPNNDISSIADALQDAGILQTLTKDDIKSIDSPDAFATAFEKEIQNRLDEQHKRISEALNYKVPITLIQSLESNINTLNGISEDMLRDETDESENYRKNLIYQNYINKGIPEKEAVKLVNNSVKNGDDIEDAIEALEECKTYYNNTYEKAIKDAKEKESENRKAIAKQAEDLRKSILEDDKFFEGLDVSKTMRQKIYDTVSKPVHQVEGGKITEFQKYIKENPNDFYKNAGMFYVLTDGFKDLTKLISGPVRNAQKKSNDKLKSVLNSTRLNDDGSLKYQHGVSAEVTELQDLGEWNLG